MNPHTVPQQIPGEINTDSGKVETIPPGINPQELPAELRNHPRYEIVKKLGQGGMGIVFQARHKMMNRQVAIKLINRNLGARQDAILRFQREIQTVAQLNHRNISTAYDAETVGDLHMLVMEYIEGIDLSKLIQQRGQLQIRLACFFMRQAALGLQHADDLKMVHRDIKPQNLMVMKDGTIKILDFGLARLATEEGFRAEITNESEMMGTPYYMSPEQAQNAKKADIRSDLYSLGCTFYHLLTGRPPLSGTTLMELLWAHREREPDSIQSVRPEIPDGLAKIVHKLLAKNPDERFQKPSELATALVPYIQVKSDSNPSTKSKAVSGNKKQQKQPDDYLDDDIDFGVAPAEDKPAPRKQTTNQQYPEAQIVEAQQWYGQPSPPEGQVTPNRGGEPSSRKLRPVEHHLDSFKKRDPQTTSELAKVANEEAKATRFLFLILALVVLIGVALLYVFLVVIPGSSTPKKATSTEPTPLVHALDSQV